MSCNEGRILHLLGSTSRSVSNGMMYPPYAPWKRGNLIKTNQGCDYLFFSRGTQGEGVGVLVVIFVGENNDGLWPLSSMSFEGGGIFCLYIGKDECVGVIFVAVRMFRLELISVEYINII